MEMIKISNDFYATVHSLMMSQRGPKTCNSWRIVTLLWFWQILCVF